ncbi:hypothetical protein D3C84_954520 [compost metagenome]
MQALGQQGLGAQDQILGPGDRRQRLAVQLAQATAQQAFGFQQQFDLIQVEGNQVRPVFPGQFIHRPRQFGDRQHAGHRRAALEGVQGPL